MGSSGKESNKGSDARHWYGVVGPIDIDTIAAIDVMADDGTWMRVSKEQRAA